MKIFIASDHAGYEMKKVLTQKLEEDGYDIEDLGPYQYDESDDYPSLIRPLAERVAQEIDTLGIILGGSGQGEAMVANKVRGIRAGVFYGTRTEGAPPEVSSESYDIVRLLRTHNNANVLSLGARFLTLEEAYRAVTIFITTPFGEEERHTRRIRMIDI